MTLFWLIACNNQLVKEYEQEKDLALQTAPPLKNNWKPDILLRLNYKAISKIATRYVEKEIKSKKPLKKKFFGKDFVAKPKLELKNLILSDAPAKDEINFKLISKEKSFYLEVPSKKHSMQKQFSVVWCIELDNGENKLSFSKLKKVKTD